MGRKRRDELDEPTKIDADFEKALEAMLNDPELPPIGEPLDKDDDQGTEDA